MTQNAMTIPTQAELVRQINEFLERHQMKPSRLAREATGEPSLIDSILSGKRSPTLNTVEKLAKYMRAKDRELPPPPLELTPPPHNEAEIELPFVKAPATQAGAPSSPTSSSTNGHRSSLEASRLSPSCSDSSDADRAAAK